MPDLPAGSVAQARAVVLTDYVRIARSVGLDAYALLREFGLDPGLLAEPEARMPAAVTSQLLEESALRSGCDCFGLLLAETRSFASLGPLSLLLRHEENLRAMFGRLIQYRRLMSDVIDFELQEDAEESRLIVMVAPEAATRQTVELVMALTCRFLNEAIFGGWHMSAAHFRHEPPESPQVHLRVFRTTLRFASSFNGFVCPTAALDRRNAYGDAGFVRHAERYAEWLLAALPPMTFRAQVRDTIRGLIPLGLATLPKAAAQLNMHPRALQRRLTAEDASFTWLVEVTREELARELLANTDLPIAEVGLLSGYASPAAFSRWFAARTGQPPRAWRSAYRSAAATTPG